MRTSNTYFKADFNIVKGDSVLIYVAETIPKLKTRGGASGATGSSQQAEQAKSSKKSNKKK
jgi:hypothetical protein